MLLFNASNGAELMDFLCISSVGAGNFSPHPRVQTGSGAYPASYPVRIRSSFPVGKAIGA
jgi:hypothetical protein